MENYDKERMELSTRDKVAIANYTEIIEGRGSKNGGVFLDISHKDNAFVHQGISQRKFSRNFVLAEDVLVKGSDLSNGILSIFLERVVPEEKKARTIDIGKVSSSMKKQFLAE